LINKVKIIIGKLMAEKTEGVFKFIELKDHFKKN